MFALALIEVSTTLNGQIVRLGSPRCPNNFPGISIDQGRHLLTRLFNCRLGLPTKRMGTRGRITIHAVHGQALRHAGCYTGIDRGCGGIIKIDRQLHC